AEQLHQTILSRGAQKTILVVECYTGVHEDELLTELQQRLKPSLTVAAKEALLPPAQIDTLVAPFLGGNDPVFGFLSGLVLPQFFDQERLVAARESIERVNSGLVLVVGCGASLVHRGDILVYADLARWEAQNRFRRNESSNLGVENRTLPSNLQYKR